jgi:polysaccharide biosynthesis protein PslG
MDLGIHIHNIENFNFSWSGKFRILRVWDCGCVWAELEKSRGDFDFSKLDQIISSALLNGWEICMVLGMTPGWATPVKNKISVYGKDYIKTAPPICRDDWERYLTTIAERYKGKIKYWEIWNEFDWYYFYTGKIEDIISLTARASTILKSINHNSKIVAPSISSYPFKSWLALFKYLFTGYAFIDIFNFHYYQIPFVPSFVLSIYILIMKLICGRKKPLWLTECGFLLYKKLDNKKFKKIFKLLRICEYFKIDKFFYYALDGENGLLNNENGEDFQKFKAGVGQYGN